MSHHGPFFKKTNTIGIATYTSNTFHIGSRGKANTTPGVKTTKDTETVANKINIPIGALVFVTTTNRDYYIDQLFSAPASGPWGTGTGQSTWGMEWLPSPYTITTTTGVPSPYTITTTGGCASTFTSNKAWVNNKPTITYKVGGVINSNTTMNNTTQPVSPVYQTFGYKTVDDYLLARNMVEVIQEKSYSKEELDDCFAKTGMYPEFGHPFCGIVIDKFAPKLSTDNGELIKADPLPILYKVLVDEKNVLWFSESEIAPMEPGVCPLKEKEMGKGKK